MISKVEKRIKPLTPFFFFLSIFSSFFSFPSCQPGMTEELRAQMGTAAVNAAKAVGYVGAGADFLASSPSFPFSPPFQAPLSSSWTRLLRASTSWR